MDILHQKITKCHFAVCADLHAAHCQQRRLLYPKKLFNTPSHPQTPSAINLSLNQFLHPSKLYSIAAPCMNWVWAQMLPSSPLDSFDALVSTGHPGRAFWVSDLGHSIYQAPFQNHSSFSSFGHQCHAGLSVDWFLRRPKRSLCKNSQLSMLCKPLHPPPLSCT